MNTAYSRVAGAERLWSLLPGWHRARDEKAQGVLRALCDVLGGGLDDARDDVLRLLADQFVETCHPDLIPLIGDLVGAEVDPTLPVARRRHQVHYALHLARRRGSVAQLEALAWQLTGGRTRVIEPAPIVLHSGPPPVCTRISGTQPVTPGTTAQQITGAPPPGQLRIDLQIAWPVRRTSRKMTPVGVDVHAVDASRAVGLRRADGTPIFLSDNASSLVGPGLDIEVSLADADLSRLGRLHPVFMPLGGTQRPYVPDRCLAIDPERGRVAGPTAPMTGIMSWRTYQITFWEPLRAHRTTGQAAHLGEGVFTFDPDGQAVPLCDDAGSRLLFWDEGEGAPPVPASDERLLVQRDPAGSVWGDPTADSFVIMPAGVALESTAYGAPANTLLTLGQGLDHAGLGQFFSLEDAWGWDMFRRYRLVERLDTTPVDDTTVHVDVGTGRFRVGLRHYSAAFRVRFYGPSRTAEHLEKARSALRRAIPLGQTARITVSDTAPGMTKGSRA